MYWPRPLCARYCACSSRPHGSYAPGKCWRARHCKENLCDERMIMQQFDWPKFYSHTKERPPWPRMIRATSLVPHRERALDLGCGAGLDTRYLLAEGFQV